MKFPRPWRIHLILLALFAGQAGVVLGDGQLGVVALPLLGRCQLAGHVAYGAQGVAAGFDEEGHGAHILDQTSPGVVGHQADTRSSRMGTGCAFVAVVALQPDQLVGHALGVPHALVVDLQLTSARGEVLPLGTLTRQAQGDAGQIEVGFQGTVDFLVHLRAAAGQLDHDAVFTLATDGDLTHAARVKALLPDLAHLIEELILVLELTLLNQAIGCGLLEVHGVDQTRPPFQVEAQAETPEVQGRYGQGHEGEDQGDFASEVFDHSLMRGAFVGP